MSFLDHFSRGRDEKNGSYTPGVVGPKYAISSKAAEVTGAYDADLSAASTSSAEKPTADELVAPGELTFEEDTAGGMGRHLGLVSTTLLMCGYTHHDADKRADILT